MKKIETCFKRVDVAVLVAKCGIEKQGTRRMIIWKILRNVNGLCSLYFSKVYVLGG